MKRTGKIIVTTALAATLALSATGAVFAANGSESSGNGRYGYQGSNASVTQGAASTGDVDQTVVYDTDKTWDAENMSLEDMLVLAIQDEYNAYAEYDYLIDTFGQIAPFTNIINAEATHISELEVLFNAYGYDIPTNNGASNVVEVTDLTQALEAGIQAEMDNIAMYDAFLATDLPDDVRATFEELRSASVNHLRAYERRLDRYDGSNLNSGGLTEGGLGNNNDTRDNETGRGNGGSGLRIMDPEDDSCLQE